VQTYSHILIAAAISIPLKNMIASSRYKLPEVKTKALLFGSLLPDLALILITLVCLTRDYFLNVFNSSLWNSHDYSVKANTELLNLSWTASLFDDWFFNNPVVITLQNTFHSPLLLLLFIISSYYFWTKKRALYGWFFWMCCAAMLHSIVDIPLHADDGPLVFFPFDWDYRYTSPLSYWDPSHHGKEWSFFEHSLDTVIIIFLLWHTKLKMKFKV
jgi:hypothetical protein